MFGFGKSKKARTPVAQETPEAAEAAKLLEALSNYPQAKQPMYFGLDLKEMPPAAAILEAPPHVQRCVLLQLLEVISEGRSRGLHYAGHYTRMELLWRLVQRKLPLNASDVVGIISHCRSQRLEGLSYVTGASARYVKEHGPDDEVTEELRKLRTVCQGQLQDKQVRKQVERITELLGEKVQIKAYFDPADVVGQQIKQDVEQLQDDARDAMIEVLAHACGATGGKPSKTWLKKAGELLDAMDADLFRSALTVWCRAFEQPRPEPVHGWRSSVWVVSDLNADLLKGLIWASTLVADDPLIRTISQAGQSGQKKIAGIGPRCTKVTNAVVWALGQIDRPLAIGQLAVLKSRIKNKAAQKQIDKAMRAAAERLGVPPAEVEEMAVPTYGLTGVGVRRETLGGFTAELVVTGTSSTQLHWIKPDGKPQKTAPKSVKDDYAEELKELQAAAKDVQKLIPAQRDRIDLLHLQRKAWPYDVWAERYLNHAIVGTLARRLIWGFNESASGPCVSAAWLDGRLVDPTGEPVQINTETSNVSLWHPIGADEAEILAWRTFFEDRRIKQPFKQAHREVYLLTDAERNTNVYSNRYAAHLIKQHQFNALCGVRGWKNKLRLMVDDFYPPATLELPAWNLRAEFWVEGAGDNFDTDANETGTYLYLATDQVRFYPLSTAENTAHAGGGGYTWGRWRGEAEPQPIPLDQIPLLVFSEVMRDVDLFVGVASVGNDPAWEDGGRQVRYGHANYWQDYSFGDLSATAQTRKQLLERLVPRLKIAGQCSFDDKFLIVGGALRTYKIHLGSGNILMKPNDQYLCIVPGRGDVTGPAGKVFLPFEGDRTLSIILSKAFLLADDKKITDATINSQIRRK